MPLFNIHHITRYTYEEPVRDSANQIVLFPIKDDYQELISQELIISGDPPVEIHRDYYGNEIGSFSYVAPHMELAVHSKISVMVKARPMPDDTAPADQQWQRLEEVRYMVPYIDFIRQETFPSIEDVRGIEPILNRRSGTPLETAKKLNEYVYRHFTYNQGVTDVETTLEEVWQLKAGVCQDFAHMLLVMLRMIHIPARYVSGYICPNKNGMRGEGATHAWVEAYIPFYGWLGFDPTNNCLVNQLHVRLGVGRSFSDVSPVKGTYRGTARHMLEVGVTISYENGQTTQEPVTILVPQGKPLPGETANSYRRYQELIQIQQQQQ